MLRRARGLGALLVLGVVSAACQPTPTPTPSAGESLAPFVATSHPADAPADCAYGGEIAQIKAVDRLTVEFSLCYPDAAFLAKVAMANNAIQDRSWLARYGAMGRLRANANGTGPYLVSDAAPTTGDEITLGRFDGYWGPPAKAATVVVKWSPEPSTRLRALQLDRVDGIDSPASETLQTIQDDPALQLQRGEALSTFYLGMTNTFEPFDSLRIRRALAVGIDRQQIVDAAFPPGTSLADYFTPCAIEFGCAGDPWYDHDLAAARAALEEPGFPGQLTTHIYYRDEAACGLPDPTLVARELQAQIQDDLGIAADLQPQASAIFLDNLSAGLLDGLYLLEWCPDLPDVTSFLDYHFNNPANAQFGSIDPTIRNALAAAARAADPEARGNAYGKANDAIRDLVPMIPLAHGGMATAWKADVLGTGSSPVDGEQFAAIDPGGRAQLAWMQSASPATFYCADATDGDSRRVCQNIFEGLYGFKPGSAEVRPSLAESCQANQELTVWTCNLRSGVTFHDGASLDASDVLASFAAQWDYEQPMHAGRTGAFAAWVGQFGPFLNAPVVP